MYANLLLSLFLSFFVFFFYYYLLILENFLIFNEIIACLNFCFSRLYHYAFSYQYFGYYCCYFITIDSILCKSSSILAIIISRFIGFEDVLNYFCLINRILSLSFVKNSYYCYLYLNCCNYLSLFGSRILFFFLYYIPFYFFVFLIRMFFYYLFYTIFCCSLDILYSRFFEDL